MLMSPHVEEVARVVTEEKVAESPQAQELPENTWKDGCRQASKSSR